VVALPKNGERGREGERERERERGREIARRYGIALTMLRAYRVSLDAAKLQIKGLLNNYAVGGRSSSE
jgi:hypothetical protein